MSYMSYEIRSSQQNLGTVVQKALVVMLIMIYSCWQLCFGGYAAGGDDDDVYDGDDRSGIKLYQYLH